MPLSICLDCNREVSPKARHCVHCGRPWPSRKCGRFRKAAIVLAIAGLAFGGYSVKRVWKSNENFRNEVRRVQRDILHKIDDLKTKVAGQPSRAEELPKQAPPAP